MKIINGKKIADRILADLKKQIKIKKIRPALAIILIGDDAVSHLYIRLKEKAAKKIGLRVKKYFLSSQASESEILRIIEALNRDSQINGILVQMPLPKDISVDRIIQAIDPNKDVDGFSPGSRFSSPFISSIWQAIQATKENLKNKKVVALVNSDIFGQTLQRYLAKKGLKVSYILLDRNFGSVAPYRQADILITALGRANFIKGSMIKQGAILIDGGISKKAEQVIGDIDKKSVSQKAKWLAPMPGGLGPITVARLLKNVVLAASSSMGSTDKKL